MTALIGALRVSLSAETANFEAGMKRAQRSTSAAATGIQKSAGLIKSAIAGFVSGLTVGFFVDQIKQALEYAGSLDEVARTLGVTTKDLQTFRFAAQQTGVSQDQLEVGLRRLTVTMGKAQLGSKAQIAAFNAIGISVDQLKGKTTGDVFRLMADGLSKVTDRSQRAAVEMVLMGRSGSQLDNLLAPGVGRLNELADAAEQLGVVLSAEQIQKSEETAHKLAALKTVLEANIAGAVADNADAILMLANALATLIRSTGQAVQGWRRMIAEFKAGAPFLAMGPGGIGGFIAASNGADKTLDDNARVQAFRSRLSASLAPKTPSGGTDLNKFLGGGGGGGGGKAGGAGREDHTAQDMLRAEQQFQQEMFRSEQDVLRAQQDLSNDYVERTTIGIQILDLEKQAYESELAYDVALNKLTKGKEGLSQAQADQLKAEFEHKDHLERQKLLDDEQDQRRQDVAMLEQTDFELQKNKLQSEQQLATTAKEQRDVALQLLDLSYRQERARLEAVLADEKASDAAKEDARRRLLGLNQTYGNDRQGVINSTKGPLEDYFSSVPKNANEANEAMQRLEVQGIDGAINSIVALTDGFQSFRDTAIQAIKAVLAQMIRMQLMKLAFSLFGSAAGGAAGGSAGLGGFASSLPFGTDFSSMPAPAFASGGSLRLGGLGGVDSNILSMNGLPIARVTKGETMHIVPQNGSMSGGGTVVNIHVNGNPTRETLNQIAARTKSAIAGASRAGY